MNAKECRDYQLEKLKSLLEQAYGHPPEKRALYLAAHGAEVRERAAWIRDETYAGNNKVIFSCSNCLHFQSVRKMKSEQIMYMLYCPFCGAKMDKPL